MLTNTPIWYWTFDRKGEEIRLPAIFMRDTDDGGASIEILENEFEPAGIVCIDIRDCVIRKV